MEPRADTARLRSRTDADRAEAEGRIAPAEARSWAPPPQNTVRINPGVAAYQRAAEIAPPLRAAPTFTHNAARYTRPAEAPQPVEYVDLEPELSTPPRWMLMVAGAAVAALMGALLGGFMSL